jgi:hypothetical protein
MNSSHSEAREAGIVGIGESPAELEIGMPLVLSWQTWAADTQRPLFRQRPVSSVTA